MKWEDVDKEMLEKLYYEEKLSDEMIAERFQVTQKKVAYKRKKYDITPAKELLRQFQAENAEIFRILNENSKARLCTRENINGIAKAIAHYTFGSGPAANMQAGGKLSPNDMEVLNRHMVSKLTELLESAADGNWSQLEMLYGHYCMYGDAPESEPRHPSKSKKSRTIRSDQQL